MVKMYLYMLYNYVQHKYAEQTIKPSELHLNLNERFNI